jgi:hypothetical protein
MNIFVAWVIWRRMQVIIEIDEVYYNYVGQRPRFHPLLRGRSE